MKTFLLLIFSVISINSLSQSSNTFNLITPYCGSLNGKLYLFDSSDYILSFTPCGADPIGFDILISSGKYYREKNRIFLKDSISATLWVLKQNKKNYDLEVKQGLPFAKGSTFALTKYRNNKKNVLGYNESLRQQKAIKDSLSKTNSSISFSKIKGTYYNSSFRLVFVNESKYCYYFDEQMISSGTYQQDFSRIIFTDSYSGGKFVVFIRSEILLQNISLPALSFSKLFKKGD